jgi:hypothetical protein
MEANLTFLDTLTIEQFKAQTGATRIDVKPQVMRDSAGNAMKDAEGKTMFYPKESNKFFMTWGPSKNHTGRVSAKGIPAKPVISAVEDEDGNQFFLLHEEGNGGVAAIATF